MINDNWNKYSFSLTKLKMYRYQGMKAKPKPNLSITVDFLMLFYVNVNFHCVSSANKCALHQHAEKTWLEPCICIYIICIIIYQDKKVLHQDYKYIIFKKYYDDTNSYSRIVKYTCFAVTQHCYWMAALCIWGYWHVIIQQSQYLKCPPIALTTAWHLYSNKSNFLSICAYVIWFHSSWFTARGSIFLIRLSRVSKSS